MASPAFGVRGSMNRSFNSETPKASRVLNAEGVTSSPLYMYMLYPHVPLYQPTCALRERRKLPQRDRADVENDFPVFSKRDRTPVLDGEPDHHHHHIRLFMT